MRDFSSPLSLWTVTAELWLSRGDGSAAFDGGTRCFLRRYVVLIAAVVRGGASCGRDAATERRRCYGLCVVMLQGTSFTGGASSQCYKFLPRELHSTESVVASGHSPC
jgi:hypothetical protein